MREIFTHFGYDAENWFTLLLEFQEKTRLAWVVLKKLQKSN
jgi:hypothetical protein